jgi:dipeptidyl aminopeptidase/acylaminoacyl peptidase
VRCPSFLAGALVVFVAACGGSNASEPSATPSQVPTTSRESSTSTSGGPISPQAAPTTIEGQLVGDHREIELEFASHDTTLAGTLFLPAAGGVYPAVVWVHGSGAAERLSYGDLIKAMVQSGVAFLSYDKRGVGQSGGRCCPADDEDAGDAQFTEQADDALAALEALRSRPDIDPTRVGYLGVSQAGWIVPIAAARSADVAFAVLAAAPTVTTGEEQFYSELTGDTTISDDPARQRELSDQLAAHGPSGFDPKPYLEKMDVPTLWLFGSLDGSVPSPESESVIDTLKAAGKDFSYVTFAGAGHGLLDVDPPPPPETIPTILQWIAEHTQ